MPRIYISVGKGNGKPRTHGKSTSSVYRVWIDMRRRCERPSHPAYPLYGARGITVCERWNKFENFHADMGDPPEGMSLDRTDNGGPYEPSNCRWATQREQMVNRRGCRVAPDIGALRQSLGIRHDTFRWRLNHGWSIEDALRPVGWRR